MAQLWVHHSDGTTISIKASPAVSLVNTLLSAGISIHHRCGGKAQCGTCRVKVVAKDPTKRFSNTIAPREAERLAAMGAHVEEGERLACQTYLFGDCDVYLFG